VFPVDEPHGLRRRARLGFYGDAVPQQAIHRLLSSWQSLQTP
jgi:hypothetical protein